MLENTTEIWTENRTHRQTEGMETRTLCADMRGERGQKYCRFHSVRCKLYHLYTMVTTLLNLLVLLKTNGKTHTKLSIMLNKKKVSFFFP